MAKPSLDLFFGACVMVCWGMRVVKGATVEQYRPHLYSWLLPIVYSFFVVENTEGYAKVWFLSCDVLQQCKMVQVAQSYSLIINCGCSKCELNMINNGPS